MTENSEIPAGKAVLRLWARERRRHTNVGEASDSVVKRIAGLPAFRLARHVLLYLALPDEINVEALIDADTGTAKRWYAPRCAPIRSLTIHAFDPLATMDKSTPFGIREPDPQLSPEIQPSRIDLALIPGLLYTPDGARLGNGGGYYDRFLPKLSPRCLVVGIAAEALIVPNLPCDLWDISVPIVATDAKLYFKSLPD